MSLFGAIDISGTGVQAMQTWIDADAGNIANADDVVATSSTPYAEQVAQLTPNTNTTTGGVGEGVDVSVTSSTVGGVVENDPASPLADKSGNVLTPNISLGDQLVGMVQAQEGYQADTSAITRALTAYQAGLGIGS